MHRAASHASRTPAPGRGRPEPGPAAFRKAFAGEEFVSVKMDSHAKNGNLIQRG
jgi:hypothetical protein